MVLKYAGAMDKERCCCCCTCRSIITESELEPLGGITSGCNGCCKGQKLEEILNVMKRKRLEFYMERALHPVDDATPLEAAVDIRTGQSNQPARQVSHV